MYVTLGLYTGDDGKENGNYCMTKGSLEGFRDIGKEDGIYCSIIGYM